VGNKVLEEGVNLSGEPVELKGREDLTNVLTSYFLISTTYHRLNSMRSTPLPIRFLNQPVDLLKNQKTLPIFFMSIPVTRKLKAENYTLPISKSAISTTR
jgi:hypothetical protein